MLSSSSIPPEPLRSFEAVLAAVDDALRTADAAFAQYRSLAAAGRILPNSVEAMRVELTYHSNAIEGNTLSLRETQLVLEGITPPGGKPLREIYEARNHDRALRAIEQRVADSAATARLAERDLLDVHALVLAEIDPQSAGRFRGERVLIRGSRFVPPGSHRFTELIPAMLDLGAREGVLPVIQAAELHYNFVAIHPFADGNGRTARLLMNWHLLRHGYPLTVIEVERRADYLAALEAANDGQLAPIAALVIDSVVRSIGRLIGD